MVLLPFLIGWLQFFTSSLLHYYTEKRTAGKQTGDIGDASDTPALRTADSDRLWFNAHATPDGTSSMVGVCVCVPKTDGRLAFDDASCPYFSHQSGFVW